MNATTQSEALVDPNERINRLEKKTLPSAPWMFVLLNLILPDLRNLTPVVARTYPLSEIPDAIHYLDQGHTSGKIAISG